MNEWLHFLNLQYWYCIIYSAFGGQCTETGEPLPPPAEPAEGFSAFELFVRGILDFLYAIWTPISGFANWVWDVFSFASYAYSAFIALAILAALGGLIFIRLQEGMVYGTLPPAKPKDDSRMRRWKELLALAMTTDPKSWKTAIVEADGILGEVLASRNYPGMNTGERMRSLPDNAFATLPVAWEAHRVKNFLTSGSSDFILTQREAFRVMKLYEQVFEEFQYL